MKRERIVRKWTEAERWSVRKRSWRGIEKNKWMEVLQRERISESRKENERVEEGKNNIPSYTVEWRGTERRGA